MTRSARRWSDTFTARLASSLLSQLLAAAALMLFTTVPMSTYVLLASIAEAVHAYVGHRQDARRAAYSRHPALAELPQEEL